MQVHRISGKSKKEIKLMVLIGMIKHGDVLIINGGTPEYYWNEDRFWEEDTKLTTRG